MLCVLFLLYLTEHGAEALSTQSVNGSDDQPGSVSSTCPNSTHCRTLWNIIWSCLVTIFACTWLAIHPNIPGSDEGFLRVGLRRGKVMVLGLLAPELLILWAIRQWVMARFLAKKYEIYGWTQTHGFFALMGGFCIIDNDGKRRPFPLYDLEEYLSKEIITITKEEIQDRSKGDVLSKVVVLVQTTWFIVQLIARRFEHLPVSELELVTVAFAMLNFVTYGLWWNKPLDVRCPVVIQGGFRGSTASFRSVQGGGSSLDRAPETDQAIPPELSFDMLRNSVDARHWHELPHGIMTPRDARSAQKGIWRGVYHALDTILGSGDRIDVENFCRDKQRVPTFYWGSDLVESDVQQPRESNVTGVVMLVAAIFRAVYGIGLSKVTGVVTLIASVFGGVHCLAWSFYMPSEAEKVLWRISAIIVTLMPAQYVGVNILHRGQSVRSSNGTITIRYWLVPDERLFLFGPVILYIIARATLLVQAFVLLRMVPQGMYTVVHWTNFIPHI